MRRRSFLQCLAGAFLVPWDSLAAKPAPRTGFFGRSVMDLPEAQEAQTGVTDLMRGSVDIYESDFGVYPNKQAAMGAEFKRDTLDEFVYDISPKQTPLEMNDGSGGAYHEWKADGLG